MVSFLGLLGGATWSSTKSTGARSRPCIFLAGPSACREHPRFLRFAFGSLALCWLGSSGASHETLKKRFYKTMGACLKKENRVSFLFAVPIFQRCLSTNPILWKLRVRRLAASIHPDSLYLTPLLKGQPGNEPLEARRNIANLEGLPKWQLGSARGHLG